MDQIPKETLKESFKCFLRSFELYVGDKDPKSIDSKTVIQDFLKEESALYRGNEIILHCLCAVAVKYSVGTCARNQANTNWSISGGELCWVTHSKIWGELWQTSPVRGGKGNTRDVYLRYSFSIFQYSWFLNQTFPQRMGPCWFMPTLCSKELWTSTSWERPMIAPGIFIMMITEDFLSQTTHKQSGGWKLKNPS